jgi:hypothetical protein
MGTWFGGRSAGRCCRWGERFSGRGSKSGLDCRWRGGGMLGRRWGFRGGKVYVCPYFAIALYRYAYEHATANMWIFTHVDQL